MTDSDEHPGRRDGPAATPYAAIVAVGPGPLEVPRLKDLADSIAHHEPGAATLVIVDDAPTARKLATLVARPGMLDAIDIHHVRHSRSREYTSGKGICSAIMAGVQAVQQRLAVRFALKLDTDSLVIAPFRARMVARLDRHPRMGMIGAYRHTPTGAARDWTMHERPIGRLARRWMLPRASSPPAAVRRHFRAVLAEARKNGYVPGEHCLGGGYALTRDLLDRMAARGWLDRPSFWESIDLPEDVTIGMHVRAVGMEFVDDVGFGDIFGVRHIGLAFPPPHLLARGYSIIHAVKNDPSLPEAEIRAFFADRRMAEAR